MNAEHFGAELTAELNAMLNGRIDAAALSRAMAHAAAAAEAVCRNRPMACVHLVVATVPSAPEFCGHKMDQILSRDTADEQHVCRLNFLHGLLWYYTEIDAETENGVR